AQVAGALPVLQPELLAAVRHRPDLAVTPEGLGRLVAAAGELRLQTVDTRPHVDEAELAGALRPLRQHAAPPAPPAHATPPSPPPGAGRRPEGAARPPPTVRRGARAFPGPAPTARASGSR